MVSAYWPFKYHLWGNVCFRSFAHVRIRLLGFLVALSEFFGVSWRFIPYQKCDLQVSSPICQLL